METIELNREHSKITDSLYKTALEKVLGEYASVPQKAFKTTASLMDISKGMFGVQCCVYEIEGEGAILYESVNAPSKEIAFVHLLGFRKDSEVYLALKRELDEIVNTDDPEVLRRFIV